MLDYILHLSPGILIALVIVAFIALVSQAALYAKAGEPWIAAIVPVWNVMVFVDVVGRPKWQSFIIMVPGTAILIMILLNWTQINGLFPVIDPETLEALPGPTSFSDLTTLFGIMAALSLPMIVFGMIVFTEICDSFGKHSVTDKVLCIIFNGAYILFVIGLSPAEYEAPWYKKKRGIPYVLPEDPRKKKAEQMAKAKALAQAHGGGRKTRTKN